MNDIGTLYRCPITGRDVRLGVDGKRIAVNGLATLILRGVKDFEDKTGATLPGNLVVSSMSTRLRVGSTPRDGKDESFVCVTEEAERLLWEYGRIGGWLRDAAHYPAVAKVIFATQSPRGINSPRTTVPLEGLWTKFPSLGGLERKLWAVRRRAEAILSAYDGDYTVAWRDVARGVLVNANVGKAALIAAAYTVAQPLPRYSGTQFRSVRQARDFLVAARTASFPAETEVNGFILRHEAEPSVFEDGRYAVYRARLSRQHGRFEPAWLIHDRREGKKVVIDRPHYWDEATRVLSFAKRDWESELLGLDV